LRNFQSCGLHASTSDDFNRHERSAQACAMAGLRQLLRRQPTQCRFQAFISCFDEAQLWMIPKSRMRQPTEMEGPCGMLFSNLMLTTSVGNQSVDSVPKKLVNRKQQSRLVLLQHFKCIIEKLRHLLSRNQQSILAPHCCDYIRKLTLSLESLLE
jgi:hypothetical protein